MALQARPPYFVCTLIQANGTRSRGWKTVRLQQFNGDFISRARLKEGRFAIKYNRPV